MDLHTTVRRRSMSVCGGGVLKNEEKPMREFLCV